MINIVVRTRYTVSALLWHSLIQQSLGFYLVGKYTCCWYLTHPAFSLTSATGGLSKLPLIRIDLAHLPGNRSATYRSGLQSVITWRRISGMLSVNRYICSGQCCSFKTTYWIPLSHLSTQLEWFAGLFDKPFAFPFNFPVGYTTLNPQQNRKVNDWGCLPFGN